MLSNDRSCHWHKGALRKRRSSGGLEDVYINPSVVSIFFSIIPKLPQYVPYNPYITPIILTQLWWTD